VNVEANASFLESCQSTFGGIAKYPGENPDPFHTYMSLASLSIYPLWANDEGIQSLQLQSLDVPLTATVLTVEWARRHLQLC